MATPTTPGSHHSNAQSAPMGSMAYVQRYVSDVAATVLHPTKKATRLVANRKRPIQRKRLEDFEGIAAF